MSDALGPDISSEELNAIAKTVNLFESDDASQQNVAVVAAVAAKVGPEASSEDLDMMVKLVASQQNGLAESGLSLQEAKRMSKLLQDLVKQLLLQFKLLKAKALALKDHNQIYSYRSNS